MASIDEVKSRIDIVDLVSESGVKLRKSGKNYSGFCPFHPNTRSPAFFIFPETGTWRCFGQCNEGGDIFKFVMKKENVDFREALQRLADKAGIKLESFKAEAPEQVEANARLRKLLEEAVTFFRHQLFSTHDGKPALDYLSAKRGLSGKTIESFELGYAPNSRDALLNQFKSKKYTEQELLDVGLLSQREDQTVFDRFRNRIMFPIRDADGKISGFGARILDPNDVPKFLNSPQTTFFDKGHLLYGLDRARKPIRAADQVVIVEGYLDVIALHQAGFENVVSPMGTALTEDQLRLLKKFSRKIVLALDPDTAGQKAVLRGLEAARASMDREEELRFDARGLLRHEARLQADLRVANIPDELDPDEIVARNPQEWKSIIENAQPIVIHVLETLAANQNINDAKVKTNIAAQVLPLIEDLPDPIMRDDFRQRLARRLRVDERTLIGKTTSPQRVTRRRPQTEQPAIQNKKPAQVNISPVREIEKHILEILIKNSELLPKLDRSLQESGLSALAISDFDHTDTQIIFSLISQSHEQDEKDTARYVKDHLDEDLRSVLDEINTQKTEGAKDKLGNELLRQTIQLRRMILTESTNQLRFQLEDAQASGESVTIYHELVLQQTKALNFIDKARQKLSEYRKG